MSRPRASRPLSRWRGMWASVRAGLMPGRSARIAVPRRDLLGLGGVALAIGGAPLLVSAYYLSILTTVGMYTIATVGLCLLAGYTCRA